MAFPTALVLKCIKQRIKKFYLRKNRIDIVHKKETTFHQKKISRKTSFDEKPPPRRRPSFGNTLNRLK